jgi:drug/metabolite transporter (DMT)-like permease
VVTAGIDEAIRLHHALGLGSVVLLALLSAASYGFAAVLQHRAAVRQPAELAMRAGLLVKLVGHPLWLLGVALDGVGYVFQFLALRRGSLALVEPLLVLSLVFALPLAASLDRRPVSTSELASVGATVAGLALFLGVGRPGAGRPDASGLAWLVLSIVIALAVTLMALGARGGSARRAAILLGAGSGTAFGYVAAVSERTGHLLDLGLVYTLTTWAPYALALGGAAALLLTQSAFQAGELRFSLPTLTIAQPLVAIAIGLGFFGEHINSKGLAPLWEVIGLIVMTVGVYALARPSVIGVHEEEPTPPEPGPPRDAAPGSSRGSENG